MTQILEKEGRRYSHGYDIRVYVNKSKGSIEILREQSLHPYPELLITIPIEDWAGHVQFVSDELKVEGQETLKTFWYYFLLKRLRNLRNKVMDKVCRNAILRRSINLYGR